MNSPSAIRRPKPGFTLVELLVVIAIIGVLASLAVVAVQGAMGAANKAAVKIDLDNLHLAFEEYKSRHNAYPPNCLLTSAGDVTNVNAQVANDLRRHFKKAFPKHREPDIVFNLLVGATGPLMGMQGGGAGMRADEALYFWLTLSDDPKYPISGPGGPSFLDYNNNEVEDLESRNFIFDFNVQNLGPRDASGRFDDNLGRWISYPSPIPGDSGQDRRINLWVYSPAGRPSVAAYFDTSRHAPVDYDPGSQVLGADPNLLIYAIKKRNRLAQDAVLGRQVQFATPKGFQILHPGLDDEWGDDFGRMSYQAMKGNNPLVYPDGPFTLEIADTQTNFSAQTLEDSEE